MFARLAVVPETGPQESGARRFRDGAGLDVVRRLGRLSSVGRLLAESELPDIYAATHRCEVKITPSWSGFLFQEFFWTLLGEDILHVNDAPFSGLVLQRRDLLHGVVPSGSIVWTSGSSPNRRRTARGWKFCRTEAMPSWSIVRGALCRINRQGCFESGSQVQDEIHGGCLDEWGDFKCTVNMSNDGSALDVVHYDAGEFWTSDYYYYYYYYYSFIDWSSSGSSVTLNGVSYIFDSRKTLVSTGFQGALASGELGWDGLDSPCPRITICPQAMQTLVGPWGDTMWTCTVLGDPCSLPFVSRGVSFDACTQQFSDLNDTDGDGNLHNGHPRCTTTLGESLCGPCSCGPGEEQGYVTSSVYLHTSPVALITCTPCAAGKFKLLGHNSGPDECELCPLGLSSSGGATACTACVTGRYRGEESPDCKLCKPGFFQNGSGQTACEICGIGQYTSNDAQTACQMCSVGSVLIAADVGCQTCEPGSMASRILATACALCSVGTFQELRGQSSCINCSVAFDPQTLNAHLWTTMVSAPIDGQLVWHETPGASSFASCGCRAGSWADLHGQCHECGEGITCRGTGGKIVPSRLLPFFWDVFHHQAAGENACGTVLILAFCNPTNRT